jgi:class 3 adenylate cyclase/GAF domain-containing protein
MPRSWDTSGSWDLTTYGATVGKVRPSGVFLVAGPVPVLVLGSEISAASSPPGREAAVPGTTRPVLLPAAVWLLHMALPLLGLWLLIARPELDLRWDQRQAHFWLVAIAAAVSLALAVRVNEQARTRSDARLFLVSLAFIATAGFLGLHALATPGVLLHANNLGFTMAAPLGLYLASGLALVSSFELADANARRVVRWQVPLRTVLAVGLIGATVLVLTAQPGPASTEAHGPLVGFAVMGSALYLIAAIRYYLIHRRRPAALLLSIITALVLLGEALIAMVYARNWAASWWEWHVLMLLAFGSVAYSAHVLYRREGSRSGLFNSVALEQTLGQVRREHTAALEALVDAMGGTDRAGIGPVTARLAAQFGLTERQAEVLEQGAAALARERDQSRRLEALVDVGLLAQLSRAEDELLAAVARVAGEAFGGDEVRIRVLRSGRLAAAGGTVSADTEQLAAAALSGRQPAEADHTLVLPLSVKEQPTGVLEVHRPGAPFSPQDRSVLRSLASLVSVELENARLYQHLDGLFRSYLSPDVARALLADPAQAALGGAVAEVTVLMADLSGFTPFSERSAPAEVVAMLNTYYGAVVPEILGHGGTVTQFIGDAVMALFNAPVPQPDHALRAVRAAVRLQEVAASVARDGWPRFRVGLNTGPALVGNIGSEAMRHFTAIGDTVNLSARLEGTAPPGGVVLGAGTAALVRDAVCLERHGVVKVKGRAEPVEAYLLSGPAHRNE